MYNYINKSLKGERAYKCDHCSEAFYEKSNLIRHNLMHTGNLDFSNDNNHFYLNYQGEKHYKCDKCAASFNRIHCLANHKRTHSGFSSKK